MKKIILGLFVLVVLAVTVSCKKKKDNNNDRCGEQEIKATTIPKEGTTEAPAPGTDFPLVVNIEPLPGAGATIVVTAKAEGSSSAPYFTTTIENALGSNSLMITKTPTGTSCIVEVVVTSKTCNTNQWKGSYRYSAK